MMIDTIFYMCAIVFIMLLLNKIEELKQVNSKQSKAYDKLENEYYSYKIDVKALEPERNCIAFCAGCERLRSNQV